MLQHYSFFMLKIPGPSPLCFHPRLGVPSPYPLPCLPWSNLTVLLEKPTEQQWINMKFVQPFLYPTYNNITARHCQFPVNGQL